MWFRMIVSPGTALAKSASSGSWGKNIHASSVMPFFASTFAPSRNGPLASCFSIFCSAVFSTSGCGSQVTECRMPRKRFGLAAWSASSTGSTFAPRFRLAWPTMAAAARPGP